MWVHHHVNMNGLVNSLLSVTAFHSWACEIVDRGSTGSCSWDLWLYSSAAVPRVPGRE